MAGATPARAGRTLVVAACAALIGCAGTVGDGGSGAEGAGGSAGPSGETEALCRGDASKRPGPAPLRRLTPSEYRNTVRDLFRLDSLPAFELPGDQVVRTFGFDNNAELQAPVPVLLETYAKVAVTVTAAAFTKPERFMPCAPAKADDELACGGLLVSKFGQRAFRRPLTTDEQKLFSEFFESVRKADNFNVAAQLTVQAMLQSPPFLYKPEVGSSAGDGIVPLSGWELASRLSYLLWNSMPDDELFASAAAGKLADSKELEAQARRLYESPRRQDAVQRFHAQWMGTDRLAKIAPDKAQFPLWSEELRKGMQAEAAHAAELVTDGSDAGYEKLLSSSRSWVNAPLADLYKVARPADAAGGWVDLDPSTRSGFLTQSWWLAGLSHPTRPGSILRGVFVLEKVLCAPTGSPPGNVNTSLPDKTTKATTNRDEIETIHAAPTSCKSCHQIIDQIGFGFEAYDSVGAHRTTDNGAPVDDSGSIHVDSDVDGTFTGGVELAHKLASSRRVRACIATHWFRFGMGRPETDDDACTLARMTDEMSSGGGALDRLLLSLVRSPNFRNRSAVEKP